LASKSLQCVRIAFDFVAMERAVYNSYVNPSRTVPEAQFVQDAGVFITIMLCVELSVKFESHIPVAHHSCTLFPEIL